METYGKLKAAPVDSRLRFLDAEDLKFLEQSRVQGSYKGMLLRETMNLIRSIPLSTGITKATIHNVLKLAVNQCFKEG